MDGKVEGPHEEVVADWDCEKGTRRWGQSWLVWRRDELYSIEWIFGEN